MNDCIISFIIGFSIFALYRAPKEGTSPVIGMNIALLLPDHKHCFHMHHWIIALLICIIIRLSHRFSDCSESGFIYCIYSFLTGCALTNFVFYDDAFNLIQTCTIAQPFK